MNHDKATTEWSRTLIIGNSIRPMTLMGALLTPCLFLGEGAAVGEQGLVERRLNNEEDLDCVSGTRSLVGSVGEEQ